MITADHIARAIVAACRETGENPLDTIESGRAMVRARHYAMHALAHCFPLADRRGLARMVGCTGSPGTVWSMSLRVIRGANGKSAHWWDEHAYCRVVLAIIEESKKSTAKVVEKIDTPPLKLGPLPPARKKEEVQPARLEPTGFRPASDTYERELGGGHRRDYLEEGLDRRAREKIECRDILAEAAANTAKLQAKMRKED